MKSFEWVKVVTSHYDENDKYQTPKLSEEEITQVGRLALNACKGIWRPDSLPSEAEAREEFFTKFGDVSLKTLGLQLSEDTVSKVTGRIARSFDDAVKDLSASLWKLRREFEDIAKREHGHGGNGVAKKERQGT